MRKLNKVQNIKEELQRNVSVQLMHSMNSSQMIRNLSLTLQEIATKLCHELYQREPGNPIFLCELLDNEQNLGVTENYFIKS